MSASADTLVRLAKRAASPPIDVPEILGVDDFARAARQDLRHDAGRVS